MQITKTGTTGVHFVNDEWRTFALSIQFDPDEGAEDIRRRFMAAAEMAVSVAAILKEEPPAPPAALGLRIVHSPT